MAIRSEIAEKANFEKIRYAQCWEDADVLLEALQVDTADTCLSSDAAGTLGIELTPLDAMLAPDTAEESER